MTLVEAGRRTLWLTVLLAAHALATASGAPAAAPYDWELRNPNPPAGAEVRTGDTMRLVNKTNGSALVFGERKYGINLVWEKASGSKNIFFAKQGRSQQPVLYGDKIGIAVTGNPGGYPVYKERKYGINLVYSSTQAYEWEIRGGATGTPVRWGDVVGFFNTTDRKYVVYGQRAFGINLVWSGSSAPGPTRADVSHTVRIGPFTEPLPQGCTGTVTWNFVPVRVTGTTGRTTALTFNQAFAVPTSAVGPAEYYCKVFTITPGFATGRWRIEARFGASPGASCELDLRAGMNSALLTQNKVGC